MVWLLPIVFTQANPAGSQPANYKHHGNMDKLFSRRQCEPKPYRTLDSV